MNIEDKKLIFNTLGCIYLEDEREIELTSENFVKALTMNENLKQLGYCLAPQDIIYIAKLRTFANDELNIDTLIRTFEPSIKAKPMYPDFPQQVMEMDEATFRFHQLVHYFSFALNESDPVTQNIKAWLPPVKETKKIKADKTLLNTKTLAFINKDDLKKSFVQMIEKRERWTSNEIQFAITFLSLLDNQKAKYKIGFKENLTHLIHKTLIEDNNTQKARELFHMFAQNPNDVLDCLEHSLKQLRLGGMYWYD